MLQHASDKYKVQTKFAVAEQCAKMSIFRHALLVAVTAIVVSFIIPSYFKPSYPVPEIFGTVAQGFEEVKDVFRQNFEYGWDKREAGSAFSVYKDGEKVVDLWAGYADQDAKRLWKDDTLTIIYSTTKGLAALCVAMLADRGHLDFTKPVAQYWPEFAQNGKENITVEQLMEHEAGLYITDTPFTFDLLRDHDALDKVLAEAKPKWKPGTAHGYHPVSFGPYANALISRVDPKQRSVGKFFDEEVRQPFGIEAYIGVPREIFHRVGRNVLVQPTWKDTLYAFLTMEWLRNLMISTLINGTPKMFQTYLENCGDICDFDRFADPDILNIELASISGVATAKGLAKMYGILANGGSYRNKILLSKNIIDEYVNDRSGLTPDLFLYGFLIKWKYGMDIIPQPNDGGNMFGAPGMGGQIGYADPNYKLSYGFVSRYNSPTGLQTHDPRFKRLQESVLSAVKNIERG